MFCFVTVKTLIIQSDLVLDFGWSPFDTEIQSKAKNKR